jgi:hypothetical protein
VHDIPISIIELAEYTRTIRSLLKPLLRFKVTNGETTVELEDKGVNYNKMENPINEVNGVNFYII